MIAASKRTGEQEEEDFRQKYPFVPCELITYGLLKIKLKF